MKRRLCWIAVVIGGGMLMWLARPARETERPLLVAPRERAAPPAEAARESFRRVDNAPVATERLSAQEAPAASRWQRIIAGDTEAVRVEPAQIEEYLQRNGFSGESLLTAFQASGDTNYLRMAATNHAADPRIQLAVIAHDLFPEQRQQWLDAFKQSAAENKLPNYLRAQEFLKREQVEQAFQELSEAAGKTQFHEYTMEAVQAREELLMQAGYSPAEAKVAGMAGVLLLHLPPLRDLAKGLNSLQQSYAAAQDVESENAVAAAAIRLGRELNPPAGAVNLLNQLIGIRMERNALEKLDSDSSPDFLGQSVASRLNELSVQRDQVRSAAQRFDAWLREANEVEVINYFDRMKLYGEPAAMAWLQKRQLIE